MDVEQGAVDALSLIATPNQWLWSRPIDVDNALEDEDDQVETLQEDLESDEARGRLLYFQRTRSRATPPENSPSGRLYQSVQHSVVEFSKPTMSIRSQRSLWSSSPRPLPPLKVPSLMSLTHTTSSAHLLPQSTNSQSLKAVAKPLRPTKSEVEFGEIHQKTNSPFSTKVMENPRSPARSALRWMFQPKTRNR
ncbi:TPA_asm: P4 protein [Paspalum notatum polerovirus]|uniref:P4 protein n=1 Tax=Paspalum notatum polerovirus TaxID=2885087 RepID=A0AAD2KQ93_9VIRU|nr:TPA_asm: P4 protein [Paspalum notatum polerovirus]